MTLCTFNSLNERDMDLLLLETLVIDKNFARLLLDEIDSLRGKEYEIIHVELSHTDTNLGESDVTAIIEIDNQRYGFLIEDKINAIAMPRQYQRYNERAEKAKQNGDYQNHFVFIFCPNKYRAGNSEAKQYPYHLSYERVLEYFSCKNDAISRLRIQQLQQAISKSKHSNITINDNANTFFKAYTRYKNEHYQELKLTTTKDKNGYWPQFATAFNQSYILHKLNFGNIDLLIRNAANERLAMEKISKWLKSHGCNVIAITQKGVKSACFRCEVRAVDTQRCSFDEIPETDVRQWFDAIKSLTEIAELFENVRSLCTVTI